MPQDIILGTDFLLKCHGEINFKDEMLMGSHNNKKFFKHFTQNSCNENLNMITVNDSVNFKLKDDIEVPPWSQVIIKSHCSKNKGCCNIVKEYSPHKNIMIAESIVRIENNVAPILLLNTANKPIVLKAGSLVARGDLNVRDECIFSIDKDSLNAESESIKTPENISMKEMSDLVDSEYAMKLLPLLNNYRDVIAKKDEPLGRTNILKAEIDTGDHPPIYIKQYQLAHSSKEAARKLINEMLSQKVISHSKSPWNFPLILVKKKDNTFRPCIDFRKLNDITLPDKYPLPNIGDILRNLRGAKYFSTLDLQSSYWQTELEENDKKKTAFTTDEGHFQFEVLPFGLKNAGSIFQRLMNITLAGLIGTAALIYIDDIIIFSETVEDHLDKLKKILDKLRLANLKVKLSKCSFLKNKIKFLGHEVSSEGIKIHNDHFLPLKNFPVPVNRKQVQRFLGSTNYFRSFIKNFSGIMEPITKLLRKEEKFIWEEPQQEAFQRIKNEICNAPTLRYPNFQKTFYLMTDASSTGIGAALLQEHDDHFVPIYFLSRGLTKAEKNYSTTKKEALAIIYALQKLRHIIWGYKITVLTDHQPLQMMFAKSTPEGQIGRWAMFCQEFDLSVKYIKGKENVLADALSRLNSHTIPKECESLDDDKFLIDYVGFVDSAKEWTSTELISAQKTDSKISKIRNVILGVESEEVDIQIPDINKFFLCDDILFYRKSIEKLGCREDCVTVVIPSNWEERVISLAHESAANNHMAKERTIFKLQLQYHFLRDISKTTDNIIKNCVLCNKYKARKHKDTELRKYPLPSKPFERVAMDFLGPLPLTDKGNKYILLISDYLTRFSVLFPLPNRSAAGVADKLRTFFFKFDCPKVFISDNAAEFTSDSVQNICKKHGVNKVEVSPYHPQSNGLCERINSKILQILRIKCGKSDLNKDWDIYLDEIEAAINSSFNSTLGDTPFFALYHFDKKNLYNSATGSDSNPHYSHDEYLVSANKRSEDIYNSIKTHMNKKIDEYLNHANKRKGKRTLSINDRVYVKYIPKPNEFNKFAAKWQGPCSIKKVLSGTKYEIHNSITGKSQIVHIDNLLSRDDVRNSTEPSHIMKTRTKS